MYKNFYQLKENPFNITADPSFFFPSQRHEEAFEHLLYGINTRKGIIVVTGEIGTGKTTLCRMLLNRISNKVKTALILNPAFSDIQLLQLIVQDLEINCKSKNKLELANAISSFLLQQSIQRNNVAIIIDECQNLNIRQLEQIRLLSNLETEKEKLLQIILVGQPELNDKLNDHALRQLNQRVSVRFHILPLNKGEVKHYVEHRLKIAGANKNLMFSPEAIEAVFNYSQGTPRVINVLCDRALLAGFVQETFLINEKIIENCIKEIQGYREAKLSYEYHS